MVVGHIGAQWKKIVGLVVESWRQPWEICCLLDVGMGQLYDGDAFSVDCIGLSMAYDGLGRS